VTTSSCIGTSECLCDRCVVEDNEVINEENEETIELLHSSANLESSEEENEMPLLAEHLKGNGDVNNSLKALLTAYPQVKNFEGVTNNNEVLHY
jgi:hypothetical protein